MVILCLARLENSFGRVCLLTISRGVMGAIVLATLWFLLPPEQPVDRHGKIDWIGASLGTGGLIVFNVAWK
jgi:hypothetical protein